MQLADEGLLDLDAPITNYLPADFGIYFEKPFTMRDLLNHTAGFADWVFDIGALNLENPPDLRESLSINLPPQIYEPGTVAAYSNWGTAFAAYVVGHISGLGYAAFERDNIFIPSGMNNTRNLLHWLNDQDFLQARAVGYTSYGRGGFREVMNPYMLLYPTGAVIGTAEDLARFANFTMGLSESNTYAPLALLNTMFVTAVLFRLQPS